MRISCIPVAFLIDLIHFLCRCQVDFAAISLSWYLHMRTLLALLGSGSYENQNWGGHPSVFVCLLCSPEILIRFASTSAFPVSRAIARRVINFFSYLHLFISLVKIPIRLY
jgi:hypothetical protein